MWLKTACFYICDEFLEKHENIYIHNYAPWAGSFHNML